MKKIFYIYPILVISTIIILIYSYFIPLAPSIINSFFMYELLFLLFFAPIYLYKILYIDFFLGKKLAFTKTLILLISIFIPIIFLSNIDSFFKNDLALLYIISYVGLFLPILDLFIDFKNSYKVFKKYYFLLSIYIVFILFIFSHFGINNKYSYLFFIFFCYLNIFTLKVLSLNIFGNKLKLFYKTLFLIVFSTIIFIGTSFFVHIASPSKADSIINKYKYQRIIAFFEENNDIVKVTGGSMEFTGRGILRNFCDYEITDYSITCPDEYEGLFKSIRSLGLYEVRPESYKINNINERFIGFSFKHRLLERYIYSKGFFTDFNDNFYTDSNYKIQVINDDWGILIK